MGFVKSFVLFWDRREVRKVDLHLCLVKVAFVVVVFVVVAHSKLVFIGFVVVVKGVNSAV